jgi:hypothetical protein
MFSLLNTKLLLVIIVLLASVVSYLAWQKHQIVAEQQQMSRPMRPDEKRTNQAISGWAKSVNKPQLK